MTIFNRGKLLSVLFTILQQSEEKLRAIENNGEKFYFQNSS